MELDKNELRLLSSIEIPELFISDYISLLDSDSIKVYLYILFAQKNNIDTSVLDLSKRIGSTVDIVKKSFEKLEQLELVMKKPNGYIIKDIREIELYKLYSPKLTSSLEDANNNAEKNKSRLKVISTINNTYFHGTMSPSWFTDIDMMFEKYNFSDEVVIALIHDCYDKGTLNHKYVIAVAENWYQNKIHSFDDLEKYFMAFEKSNEIKKKISKKLGFNRNLTQYEEAYIEKWTKQYNYPFEVIDLALKKTTNKSSPSFAYIDKIITDWNDKSLKTLEQIKQYNEDFNKKEKFVKANTNDKKFNGYAKSDFGDLDKFYDNIKIGGD